MARPAQEISMITMSMDGLWDLQKAMAGPAFLQPISKVLTMFPEAGPQKLPRPFYQTWVFSIDLSALQQRFIH